MPPAAIFAQVLLPVIWGTVVQGYPGVMGDLQADQKGMPKDYFSQGLYRLRIRDERAYRQCVLSFADAIHTTWKQYHMQDPYANPDPWPSTLPPVPILHLAPSIPNQS